MANRVLLGDHATFGYGLYVSKDGVDVTGSDNDHFIFDSSTASVQTSAVQVLFWKETIYTDSAHNVAQTYTFNSFGNNCFAQTFASTTATGTVSGADIRCLSQATGSARATAELGLHGGTINTTDTWVVPTYTVSITNSSTTGTVSITPSWEGGSGKDICIQVLVYSEGV